MEVVVVRPIQKKHPLEAQGVEAGTIKLSG
jgi:hypothetical protein